MLIDRIEFELTCETTEINDCLDYCSCKYDWYCTNFLKTEVSTMFYSEGE